MVSVIVPCFNCEKTFERCITSIQKQTQSNIEIILVDDGSTDSTYRLCEEAALKDPRIKVVHQPNSGLVMARKIGIKEATGEYLAFCDSDDYMEEDLIARTENAALKYNADIVVFGMRIIYENGYVCLSRNKLSEGHYRYDDIQKRILPIYFSDGKMESNIILNSVWSKIMRRSLLLPLLSLLDNKVTNGEDLMMVFAAVLSAKSIYCMGDYYPYNYMRNDESMIGKYDKHMFEKGLILREALIKIAKRFHYKYLEQIEACFLTYTFLNMKKEICRNKEAGYKEIKRNLINMRENTVFVNALADCNIQNYEIMNKIFAKLVTNRRYFLLYLMTKMASKIGIGKA